MATLFAICAFGLIVGWLWFYVARPILEAWGVLPSVNDNDAVMSPVQVPAKADKTDRRTDRPSVSAADRWIARLEVDRTRATVIEILLDSGWTITDLRRERILRGDNGEISAEVDAARKRLGMADEDRVLKVRDERGERVIPFASAAQRKEAP